MREGRRTFLETQAAKATTAADRSKFTSEAAEAARKAQEHRIPVRPRYVADDCTPEKTTSLLAEQGGRLAVLSAECDLFDLLAGRYSSSGAANFAVYLKGHAGDDLHVDRVGRPPEYVKEPALTVGLTVQPDVLRGLAAKPGFRGRGLLARFLYSIPVSLLGNRRIDAPAVPAAVRTAYHKNIAALLALTPDTDESGDAAPHILRLAPDASTAFSSFEQEVERQLSEFGELGAMADWGGKLVGAVA
ncbi:MAG: YfjI family protein, partial [Chloroflexi bacterium]|nr:YfjI family protein [Chloroflexota bacterium]